MGSETTRADGALTNSIRSTRSNLVAARSTVRGMLSRLNGSGDAPVQALSVPGIPPLASDAGRMVEDSGELLKLLEELDALI